MKMNGLKLGFLAVVLSTAFWVTSCGNNESDNSENHTEQHVHDHEHEHGHEHNHENDGHTHDDDASGQEVDKTGKAYTSAYICPMHCEGSGSDKEGNCPVCGMVYLKNDYQEEQN